MAAVVHETRAEWTASSRSRLTSTSLATPAAFLLRPGQGEVGMRNGRAANKRVGRGSRKKSSRQRVLATILTGEEE